MRRTLTKSAWVPLGEQKHNEGTHSSASRSDLVVVKWFSETQATGEDAVTTRKCEEQNKVKEDTGDDWRGPVARQMTACSENNIEVDVPPQRTPPSPPLLSLSSGLTAGFSCRSLAQTVSSVCSHLIGAVEREAVFMYFLDGRG